MGKVLTIFGTRPEAIKMGPVVHLLEQQKAIESRVVVTAQHREMLDQVLEIFSIVPDYDLDLMRARQHPLAVMKNAVTRLSDIYEREAPDCVLVQGDTTTTFAASLAAFHFGCQIGHVEAGLRSFDKRFPFPEEVNRRLTSVVSDWHFAPTSRARDNLIAEAIPDDRILVTGNTVVDALQHILVNSTPDWPAGLREIVDSDRRIILLTVHRRESWGAPLEGICNAVREIAVQRPHLSVVLPVHPNPVVQETVRHALSSLDNVLLVEPLDYLNFAHLIGRSYLVLTDSGGLQEETMVMGIPGLVLRNVTERPEGVEAGGLRLVGTDPESIKHHVSLLLDNTDEYAQMRNAENPYGDGHASQRIVDCLLRNVLSGIPA